jgi:DNA-binding response OmpR family regulator
MEAHRDHAPAPPILLVDDDPAVLDALPDTLKLRLPHIEVDTCACGRTALERLGARDYHAIITDLSMPGMDGAALVQQIRQVSPIVPVLVVTGRIDHDALRRTLRMGAYDWITKPIDREAFVLAIRRALETYRWRQMFLKQDSFMKTLSTELRRLHSILQPLLVSDRSGHSELRDDGIGQARTILEYAVQLCARQSDVTLHALKSAEQHLQDAERHLGGHCYVPHLPAPEQ